MELVFTVSSIKNWLRIYETTIFKYTNNSSFGSKVI